ncbi:hypothetical protein CPC08DRAFT_710515 [Agrocybe pediades]|nr:hypothetical protein CPC08DRAFT_710515 [Agrocybe pediades]
MTILAGKLGTAATVSERFPPGPATDCIVQSCDSILFHLHSCYLVHATGRGLLTSFASAKGKPCANEPGWHAVTDGLPQTSDASDSGKVNYEGTMTNDPRPTLNLPEPGEVLETLFDFVYPRRRLELRDLPFGQLLPLADATE